jgi:hypothetical protein
MNFTFDAELVLLLLNNSLTAKEWRRTYWFSDESEEQPGLWLVGDRGVYLISNSKEGVLKPESTPERPSHVVAYARECDPTTDDNWVENKIKYFGGDDLVYFVDAESIQRGLAQAENGFLTIMITPDWVRI